MKHMHPNKVAPVLAMVAALVSAWSAPLAAQLRSSRLGAASAGVLGPIVTTPAPIGGLHTRPLASSDSAPHAGRSRRGSIVLMSVADAPRPLSAVAVSAPDDAVADGSARRGDWTPTAERPRWILDASVPPVQAWRDLIVTDMVCNLGGACLERRQRVRARWIAGCACYAFGDAWNRIWRVE